MSRPNRRRDRVRKRTSGYYTPEKAAAARENAARYDWARDRRDDAVERAERYLDERCGLDGLWRFVTGQAIPRSCSVGPAGSPVTGERFLEEYGSYGWVGDGAYGPDPDRDGNVDPPDGPWEIVDPSSGYTFPTNDFGAYRESGLDDRGFFDPSLADDSLLVNERYPEKPDDWGVDDGYGWTDADGATYAFVAYCNHFYVWYEVRDMVDAFRDAYLLTGERRYARAATVLLDRVADVYPDLDISVWGPDDPFYNSHGNWGQGKEVGGMAWGNGIVQSYLKAYDAVFPAQDGDDSLVAFLAGKADEYDVGPKGSVGAVRANVEENVVGRVLPLVRNGVLRGGFGTHQQSLAWAAAVLDADDDYAADAVDFLLRSGEPKHFDDGTPWGRTIVTGGDVRPRVVDAFDRDGQYRLAVQYNAGKPRMVTRIADVLNHVEGVDAPDLLANPRVERMHWGRVPLLLLNRYMPTIGDTNRWTDDLDPAVHLSADLLVDAFEEYGDPVYAQAAHLLNGDSTDGIRGDLFEEPPHDVADRIEAVVEAEGPLDLPSTNMAGYGLAALRAGEYVSDAPDDQRAVWLYYGRNGGYGHNHRDALTLGAMGYELDLAPDLGYPERAIEGWPKDDFTNGTVSHNTVVVDDEHQSPIWVGTPRHFDASGRVDVVDVAAPDAYPQVEAYRRATALVEVDARRSYAVDVFRVAGGEEHLYSFHGPAGRMAAEGLDLEAQDGGTYAGPDVLLPGRGERTAYTDDVGNGYNYLDGVRRDDAPEDGFSVDWTAADPNGVRGADASVGLRLTMCTACDEVALADGEPPQKPGNPDRLGYVLARRSGREASAFASVLDPYEDDPVVESVERVPVEAADGTADPASETSGGASAAPVALRVALATGRTDYVLHACDPDATCVVDGTARIRGAFGVYAERDGEPVYAYVNDGTLVAPVGGAPLVDRERGCVEGTVVDFTRDLARENELALDVAGPLPDDPDALAGRWVHVDTDGERNGSYEVCDARVEGGRLVLGVGAASTVKSFADPDDPDAGYDHVVGEGAPARIPLTAAWERDGRRASADGR